MCECMTTLFGFPGRRMTPNLTSVASSIQSPYPIVSSLVFITKLNYTIAASASASNSNKHDDFQLASDAKQQQQERAAASFSKPNFLEFHNNGTKSPNTNNKVSKTDDGLNSDDEDGFLRSPSRIIRRKGRQTMNRSSILAKQVITIQSAITLGFVSQLWLDTTSWLVLVIELRPNLLSGQAERFLLHDIHQVGDVVLVQDESVTESEIKMVGLETLVGYNVVTPGRQNIGKVRGYNFNINSGAVVSLELDSFGISIIPSSLVSTYALFVEDVLEVVSDTVIVHEAAASRIQRLTKGFWDAQKAMKSMDEFGEYSDLENPVQPDYSWRRRRSSTSEYLQSEVGEMDVDWELPMDYL